MATAIPNMSISELLASDGPLATQIPGFEMRDEQTQMLENVTEAFEERRIALIEAGTGTGKSLAYLIPAIMAAVKESERTVISTNTINLQEQLIDKDIPMLIKALGVEIQAVLIKGMSNYLCLRKLKEALSEASLFDASDAEELTTIDEWKQTTPDGSLSTLPFVPKTDTWEKVACERDACSHRKCPHFQECFFFKAREPVANAHLLVVNHHLLFADLSARMELGDYEDPAILPPYTNLVLDEAHHLEDVATHHLAARLSRKRIQHILSRLGAESSKGPSGKLALLRKKIEDAVDDSPSQELQSVIRSLSIDLPAQKRNLSRDIADTFDLISLYVSRQNAKEGKFRILKDHLEDEDWVNHIAFRSTQLVGGLRDFIQSLHQICKTLTQVDEDTLNDKTRSIRLDIKALLKRLETACQALERFVTEGKNDETCVKWIERGSPHIPNERLVTAELDVSKCLKAALFEPYPTITLTSATLATGQQFDFIRGRLGLNGNEAVTENIYTSPFDWEARARLLIPSDLPFPTHPTFLDAAQKTILEALKASRGRAFILFTSYDSLMRSYQAMESTLAAYHFTPFRQGEASRKALLERFQKSKRAVLFGTDSFWEGVDVPGEALALVIIVKLPFQVPSEPIVEARNEMITKSGGQPFMDYSIPQAIVKFKQGVGRLIRHKSDYGCVLCLDTRLIKKGYGKKFLESLPKMPVIAEPAHECIEKMDRYYREWSVAGSNR